MPDNLARKAERMRRKYHNDPVAARKRQRDYVHTENGQRSVRNSWLQHRYGITLPKYEKMLEDQGGGCALCGEQNRKRSGRDRRLAVDHAHTTGLVRGLLCDSCNRGLGYFRDDPALLERAVKYLRKER